MLRARTASRFVVAACLLLPWLAHAAGLGRLTVQSALGQPLRAEVAIVSLQPGEADDLNARIASPDAFRQAGVEMSPVVLNIKVAIERRDGRPVLRLSSTQPVNEPFVELLVELQWSRGRLIREYTFLLDPAEYKPPQPAVPPVEAAAKPAPAAPIAAKPIAPQPAAAATYEVQRGDTLSKVARDYKPADATVNQMLVALFRANRDAFIRDNMYLVRSGHILKIPARAAVVAIDRAEATRMVKTHGVGFDEYRQHLGAAVAAAPAKPTPPSERESPGKISPKPAEPAPKDTRDQIKLSKLESAKGASAPASATPSARAAAEDEKVSLGRALKESQSRVSDLEKQVADLQKLVAMKNQQLALLEQKAGGKPPAEVPAAPAPKPAPEAAKPAAEAPKPAATAPATETPKPAAAAPSPPPSKPAPSKAKAPPPPPEPSLVDEFLGNPLALAGLGGVIVLLVGYGVWAWRRKKAAQARETGFAAISEPRLPEPVVAATAAAAVPAPVAAPAPLPVEAPAAVEEVDPIAEADVYLAYGRDAQAESILKDALAAEPNRLAAHAKLLEIYSQRKDKAGFERSALKVKELTGGSGPEWSKAASLGRVIDPGNGLYGTGEVAAAVAQQPAAAAPTLDFDIGGGAAPATGAEAAGPRLDFDIGATTQDQEAAKAFKPGDTVVMDSKQLEAAKKLDFDIGAATQETAALKAGEAKEAPPPEPAALDFDLDFDIGEAKPAAAAKPEPSPVSLDLGAPGTAAPNVDPKWQEVATKLDLAKAYQEMGDKDGARELLNEVQKEGDAAQREEAKRVLAKLG